MKRKEPMPTGINQVRLTDIPLSKEELQLSVKLSDLLRSFDFIVTQEFFKRDRKRKSFVKGVEKKLQAFYSEFLDDSGEGCPDCTPLCCSGGSCVQCVERQAVSWLAKPGKKKKKAGKGATAA